MGKAKPTQRRQRHVQCRATVSSRCTHFLPLRKLSQSGAGGNKGSPPHGGKPLTQPAWRRAREFSTTRWKTLRPAAPTTSTPALRARLAGLQATTGGRQPRAGRRRKKRQSVATRAGSDWISRAKIPGARGRTDGAAPSARAKRQTGQTASRQAAGGCWARAPGARQRETTTAQKNAEN